jgi:hypothetical protein
MIQIKTLVYLSALAAFFAPSAISALDSPVLEKAINKTESVNIIEITKANKLYKPSLDIIGQEFNLPNLKIEIMEMNVYNQPDELKNNIQFEDALRLALKSYLNDYSDQESPLAIIYSLKNNCDGNEITPEAAKELKPELRDFLNQPATALRLLNIGEKPEGEGNPETSWIFSLTMPQMYDVEYFAVVDRLGKTPVFNYGFN